MRKTGLLHYKIREKQFNIFETDMELKKRGKILCFMKLHIFLQYLYREKDKEIFKYLCKNY